MIKRIIEIGTPAYLKLRNNQLVVEQDRRVTGQIPIEDLGVLLLGHPQILITHGLIAACGQANVAIVSCAKNHLPVSLTLPNAANSTHTKTLRVQTSLPKPRQKQLWKQVVIEKITQQAQTIKFASGDEQLLLSLLRRVKSGDSSNIEAQAAKRYWKLLYGKSFSRNRDLEGTNAQLNYGYAVIRAMIARALVGTGFHPAIGINHQNQYNAYCLADDIMEPFRPWVDQRVLELNKNSNFEVNKETKTDLLNLLSEQVLWNGEKTPLMVSVSLLCARLKAAYQDPSIKLIYPLRFSAVA